MTTEAPTRNPYATRERLRREIADARIVRDESRAELLRIGTERKHAEAEAFKAEMAIVSGNEESDEHRDLALERVRALDVASAEQERRQAAADAVIRASEGQLSQLYDEAFEDFAREAEAAAAGAVTELRKLRAQYGIASAAWEKAAGLWRPLNVGLRKRLEKVNRQEGRYPDVARQTVVNQFPIQLPTGISEAAPRPAGLQRLTMANPPPQK